MSRKTYSTRKASGNLKANHLGNVGLYGEQEFAAARLTKRKKLPPLSKWKFVETFSGATIYELPNKTKIVIKPELWIPFPNAKIAAKGNNRGRHMLPLLNELMKRKVKIEVPLGEIETKSGLKLYITQFVRGERASVVFSQLSKRQQIDIAKQMARQLAQIHSRGVVHGHPHANNWLVHEGKARLVDVKGVSFKEEYPWTAKSGRTRTWSGLKQSDLEITKHVFNGRTTFLEEVEKAFMSEYELRINRLTV